MYVLSGRQRDLPKDVYFYSILFYYYKTYILFWHISILKSKPTIYILVLLISLVDNHMLYDN